MDEETFLSEIEIRPERASKLRFALAGLAFMSEVSQAVTNLFSSITVVVAAHEMQRKVDSEFGRMINDFSDTVGLGTGSAEQED